MEKNEYNQSNQSNQYSQSVRIVVNECQLTTNQGQRNAMTAGTWLI